MALVCVHMDFFGMFNLFVESRGESTRKYVGSNALSRSRSPSWEGHNLTSCMSCWSGDAALTSRVRAQLHLVTDSKEINTLPTLTFVPIQRSGSAKSQSLLCCLHWSIAEFRKPDGDSRLLDRIPKFFGCYLDKAVFTCVLYTVLLLLLWSLIDKKTSVFNCSFLFQRFCSSSTDLAV